MTIIRICFRDLLCYVILKHLNIQIPHSQTRFGSAISSCSNITSHDLQFAHLAEIATFLGITTTVDIEAILEEENFMEEEEDFIEVDDDDDEDENDDEEEEEDGDEEEEDENFIDDED
ncbi:hypothetical protein VNO78_21647 [Psophocarpus tetragonolobus]|uniref:Uncharacterized protein n=1 Tax=Psophocarpus tetragonolobus TaxID=3891 RepID=A0AAN9XI87_PSOTE